MPGMQTPWLLAHCKAAGRRGAGGRSTAAASWRHICKPLLLLIKCAPG